MKPWDAVVVGSGPNGLAAAVALARAGHSVKVVEGQSTFGGGARTLPLTLPGFQHDVCSAIHPMAAGSPFFTELELHKHGVEFVHSPYAFAHPLGEGAAVLERGVEATAARLGPDEKAWLRLMKPLVRDFEVLKQLMYNPVTKPPLGAPFAAANFGLKALQSAFWFAEENFETVEAKALLAGGAAHSFSALTTPLTNAFAMLMAVSGQVVGWPLVRGGSQKIIDALVALLLRNGGELERSQPITSLAQLPPSKLVLFDTHAHVVERICGDALPGWYRSLLTNFQLAPGVFKLDYALSGPMPWLSDDCRHAATLHLGGSMPEIAESEARLSRGELPERPFVLVAQQSLWDDSRAPAGQHTLWAYCHVPNGSDCDATTQIEAQLERYAPGFQKRVLAKAGKRTTHMESMNAAYVGGDISGGAVEGLQLVLRPGHATPNPKLLICGASSPPGPAVHGMCGYWAAQVALKKLRGAP
ncbi:MAG: NAD(P)/FAD-dependent oxidoreductase [Archangium sp.]|nr:NAD(P)/FAD-dependent oxidoreductase [Archangium sp.]